MEMVNADGALCLQCSEMGLVISLVLADEKDELACADDKSLQASNPSLNEKA